MNAHTEIEVCNCHNLEHHLIFHFDPDDNYNEFMYVNMNLNHYLPWYKRIGLAIKYIFGYKCQYGHYNEVVLDRKQVEHVRDRFNFALSKMPK